MAVPVNTLTLGGTDISARVGSARGTPTVVFGRGASFDGGTEPPGYLRVTVKNADKAFNPRNGASPLASVLKIGQPVRLSTVYSATTYYLFHGFLRRIVPVDDGFAELHCDDAFSIYDRKDAHVAASVSRSVNGFRGALLTDAGELVGNRNLSNIGPEQTVTFTGADRVNVLNTLQELNRGTGTIHFIKPTSTAYQYTTIDRTVLQSNASVETWSDTDLTNPFAVALNAFDYTDERIINQQRVEATPRLIEDSPVTVWQKEKVWLPAGVTRTRWPRFDDPTFGAVVSYEVVAGSGTVTLTPFHRTAKLVIAAGGSNFHLRNVQIIGRRALEVELDASVRDDAASQTAYGGIYRGNPVQSDYINSEAWSDALADWYLYRYATPRGNPGPTFENRFPTQLVREIGDRITYTSAEHSLSGVQMLIMSFETVIYDSSNIWRTTYQLEEMPAAVTLFTLGGTAAQGVGGTGVLAI